MKTALSIAGSDSCGGAGIQADIKTMTVNGVYAMTAITALTAQNTMEVKGILEIPPEFLKKQLMAVFEDITPNAVKIGMVSSLKQIEVIAEAMQKYSVKNIVIDPVMVSTSGTILMNEDTVAAMKKFLFPLADIITPNIPESEVLTEMKIESPDDMIKAAKKMNREYGCSVLLKGGHSNGERADDLLFEKGETLWLRGMKIENPNTHGTGCTLSSAIAANLAKGEALKLAVQNAKEYTKAAILANLNLGKGPGPIDHAYILNFGG